MAHCNQIELERDNTAEVAAQTREGLSALVGAWRKLAGAVGARMQAHRRRRRFKRLHDLDDQTLADIGVTREEIHLASGLPVGVNAAEVLQRMSLQRRRKEARGELPR